MSRFFLLCIGLLLFACSDKIDNNPSSSIVKVGNFLQGTVKTENDSIISDAKIVLFGSKVQLVKTLDTAVNLVPLDTVYSDRDGIYKFEINYDGLYSIKVYINETLHLESNVDYLADGVYVYDLILNLALGSIVPPIDVIDTSVHNDSIVPTIIKSIDLQSVELGRYGSIKNFAYNEEMLYWTSPYTGAYMYNETLYEYTSDINKRSMHDMISDGITVYWVEGAYNDETSSLISFLYKNSDDTLELLKSYESIYIAAINNGKLIFALSSQDSGSMIMSYDGNLFEEIYSVSDAKIECLKVNEDCSFGGWIETYLVDQEPLKRVKILTNGKTTTSVVLDEELTILMSSLLGDSYIYEYVNHSFHICLANEEGNFVLSTGQTPPLIAPTSSYEYMTDWSVNSQGIYFETIDNFLDTTKWSLKHFDGEKIVTLDSTSLHNYEHDSGKLICGSENNTFDYHSYCIPEKTNTTNFYALINKVKYKIKVPDGIESGEIKVPVNFLFGDYIVYIVNAKQLYLYNYVTKELFLSSEEYSILSTNIIGVTDSYIYLDSEVPGTTSTLHKLLRISL